MCEELQESPKQAHKHAELIKQWAEGAEIQFYNGQWGWMDCTPTWDSASLYRVKPEKVFISYRVALMKNECGFFTQSTDINNYLEKHSEFVRWLTDWTKVEC